MNKTLLSFLKQGEEYANLGRFKDAEGCFGNAYEAARLSEDIDALIQAGYHLGKLYAQWGTEFYGDAEIYLQEALETLDKISTQSNRTSRIMARIRNQFALLYYQQNKLTEALQMLETSRSKIEGEQATPELAEALHYSGLVLQKQRKKELGYECYQRAMDYYTQLSDSRGQAKVCDSIANALSLEGDLQRALFFYERSLQEKERHGDLFGQAISHGGIGRLKLEQGKLEEAEEELEKSLKISEQCGVQRGMGIMLNSLGDLYTLKHEIADEADRASYYQKAVSYYQESLNQIQGDPINTIFALFGLAQLNLDANLPQAKECCLQAERLVSNLGDKKAYEGKLKSLLGGIARREGLPEGAEEFLREAEQVFQEADFPTQRFRVLMELSRLYHEQNNEERSLSVAMEALKLLEHFGAEAKILELQQWLHHANGKLLLNLILSRHLEVDISYDFLDALLRDQVEKQNLEKELELAWEVQSRLLPVSIPQIPGLDIVPQLRPCHQIGGDYYDVIVKNNGRQIGLAIGDVCGKGIPAALLMSNLQANLRILAQMNYQIQYLVSQLDEIIARNVSVGEYITFFYGEYTSKTQEFRYCNAGHPPPLVFRNTAETEKLERGGTTLGFGQLLGIPYEEASVQLSSGDILLLYTDGIVEAANPHEEQFEQERLIGVVRNNMELNAESICQNIFNAVEVHSGNAVLAADDMTLIVMRVLT